MRIGSPVMLSVPLISVIAARFLLRREHQAQANEGISDD
jgi:hypothetical protein